LLDICQRINESEHFPGISIRDYFASAAMQGMAARELVGTPTERAEAAYLVADAMLAEREK
jgi:hypothetical protein